MIFYIVIYLAISVVYRYRPNDQQLFFEGLVRMSQTTSTMLPLTFLLAFYVGLVVKRWWEQYAKLPWPDAVATDCKMAVTKGCINEAKTENLEIRRTIVRYCLLSYILCIRRISTKVRKEYPSMEHIITARIIRKDEAELIGDEEVTDKHGDSNWWLPLKWCIDIIRKADVDGRIANPVNGAFLVKSISAFRTSLIDVSSYGFVTIPLVYTQVVHLAVYIHFAVQLVGEQWIKPRKEGDEEMDFYFPFCLTFEFLFFYGWLKVAMTMYNPCGCDDEDFEILALLKRHIQVAYEIVDEGEDFPEVRKDELVKSKSDLNNEEGYMKPSIDKEENHRENETSLFESKFFALVKRDGEVARII